jgi:hypothetical protein
MISIIKTAYDKIILIFVLLALLVTAAYLHLNLGAAKKEMATVEKEIVSYTKSNPDAKSLDLSTYKSTLAAISNPYQMDLANPGWTNIAMFVPEARVICVDCKLPIRFYASRCPFCGTEQPPLRAMDPTYDGDKDGMPDLYEKEHGLNHRADDSHEDLDEDGFSNIVEFKSGTSPSDPTSYPPPDTELTVVSVVPDSFDLLFKSSSRLPDQTRMFQINLKDGARTHFVKIGEKVEGFQVLEFIKDGAEAQKKNQRASDVLVILSPSDKEIKLIEEKGTAYKEYTVTFKFNITDEEFKLRAGDNFKLKNKEYEFIGVDKEGQNIVIKRLDDEKLLTYEVM